MTPNIILASQSPRRKDLLDRMGLDGKYEVIPSEYVEILDDARTPGEVSEELGYGKALWVAERHPGAWTVGSDTIVTVDGKQLGKAADEQEALEMLKLLSGKHSTVTTSAVLLKVELAADQTRVIKHYIGHEEADVYFKPFNQAAVDTYIASNDWRDKAGAYGIQSGAATLIDYVSGNYDTILGLPTHSLAKFFAEVGIEVQAVELEPPVPRR